MAPTDITWNQVNQSLIDMGLTAPITIDAYGNGTAININNVVSTRSASSAVEFVSRLLEACRNAQEVANNGKVAPDRLTSFPTSTIGTATLGYVPVTRSVVGRYELASAKKIVAANG